MSKRIVSITAAFLTLSALQASAQDKSKYIVGGAAENGHEAVGALMDGGEQFCTGTLVAPTTVVTAAHCLIGMGGSNISFFIGQDAKNPESGMMVSATALYTFPEYDDNELTGDIGVVLLDSAPSGVEPIAPHLEALPDVVGQDALFVGYGLTGPNGDYGDKLSVTIPVSKLEPTTLWYETPGKNTCNGDSGGPALMQLDGTWQLIGVTSYGDTDCAEYGVNTRVDAFAAWVSEFMDGTAPEGSVAQTPGSGAGSGGAGSGGGGVAGEGDVCEAEGWYGDGICDSDCPKPDSDCADGGGSGEGGQWDGAGDFCEEMGWYGDGICDEDCDKPDSDCGDNGELDPSEDPSEEPAEEPSQPDTIEPETAQPETGSDLPAATPPASELVSGMSSSGADGGC
ncbi:MAG: hypothetical protein ACI9WU_001898, partial [Myxococcota bacterium]